MVTAMHKKEDATHCYASALLNCYCLVSDLPATV